MISLEVLAVFFSVSVALGLAPGPDNIFVLTQSALYGRLAGFVVTLGLCTGLMVHTTAVAVGVAALFQASALAFTVLKAVGAAYLLYLAWQAFRSGTSSLPDDANSGVSLRRLFGRGIVMNVTNPKVAIFFLAFLPQFADPVQGSLTLQLFILGGVFMLATLVVFGAVAWGAGFLGAWLKRSPRAQTIMNRVAGTVFVGLAFRLATAER
ncbi:MAG: LysE family translocator [Alphaproteobacteria bacterium]|nr:LysE family translocator [Alphaproteobacteria bacterium]